MKLTALNRKSAMVGCMAFLLAACTTSSSPPPPGESLAGWKGNVRRSLPLSLTVAKGDCPGALREYIAASGHSAYASTDLTAAAYEGKNFICGVALNRKSVEEAEALALRGCQNGARRWTHAYSGKCEIHASK
ncbi:hypothetical protein [Nitratireductor sp. XY-223]|uniref:hypothetical protein n=1 Tax=Nitratireductor sp. XY-223 TaxID=2561926 RepID=UPI0010A9B00B|nr:hypothetical protein [Nitratireductor sp. XY-223]